MRPLPVTCELFAVPMNGDPPERAYDTLQVCTSDLEGVIVVGIGDRTLHVSMCELARAVEVVQAAQP